MNMFRRWPARPSLAVSYALAAWVVLSAITAGEALVVLAVPYGFVFAPIVVVLGVLVPWRLIRGFWIEQRASAAWMAAGWALLLAWTAARPWGMTGAFPALLAAACSALAALELRRR